MMNQPFKRTHSMELRAIRDGLKESPPPAPAGTSVREWFAGLALANPTLMHGVPEDQRAPEAVRLADDLIKALAVPKTPSQASMTVPTTEDGLVESWNHMANSMRDSEKKERQTRDTKAPPAKCLPPSRRTQAFGAILPPPLVEPEVKHAPVPTPERPTQPDRPTLLSGPKLQRPPTPPRSFSTEGRYAHFRGNLGTDLEGPAIKHFDEE